MKLEEAAKDANAKDAKASEKDKLMPKASKGGAQTERNRGSNAGVNGADAVKEKDATTKEKKKDKSEASGMISPESLEATQ